VVGGAAGSQREAADLFDAVRQQDHADRAVQLRRHEAKRHSQPCELRINHHTLTVRMVFGDGYVDVRGADFTAS